MDTHIWIWWVNGDAHKDPADQMIVATARVLSLPLLTMDAKMIAYPHVPLVTV